MKILAVAAHAADVVNKCGGTLALHAAKGDVVSAAALSFGERGESTNLWKSPGITLAQVKAQRIAEISRATEILGIELKAFDFGDHLIEVTPQRIYEVAMYIRTISPDIIITHNPKDLLNPDHATTYRVTEQAIRLAATAGETPEIAPIGRVERYCFEPNHTELMEFDPTLYVDVTPVFDTKRAAIRSYETQPHLEEAVELRAKFRGNCASHLSKYKVTYAEAFQRIGAVVLPELLTDRTAWS